MTAEVVLHILRAFALVLLFMPLSFPSAASKPLNRDSGRSLLGAAKSKLSSRSRMAYWRLPTAFGPETLVLRMHGGVSHFAMEYSCNGVTIGEFSSPYASSGSSRIKPKGLDISINMEDNTLTYQDGDGKWLSSRVLSHLHSVLEASFPIATC
jgi:hypothetical protein